MVMNDPNLREATIEKLRKDTLPNSELNKELVLKLKPRMTSNFEPLYGKSEKEKELILHHVRQKFFKIKTKKDIINSGKKNLLYFSVFLGQEYTELLYVCLKSIITNTPSPNFDILFITDVETRKKIETFDIISKFNVDYLVYPSVQSGPLASLKKLDIFSYKKISAYSKILFFDTDIVCIKNLNIIFDKELESEILYTCSPVICKSPTLLSPTHGIMYLTRKDAEFLYDNPDIIPFNAGQFMFLNSSRMREHFANVIWLKDTWPCEYFYEQSFMNYYFTLRGLTTLLTSEFVFFGNERNQLIAVTYNPIDLSETKNLDLPAKMHSDQTVAIHFASIQDNKKLYIDFYTNAYKLHI